jgi:polyisoprenyl-phosphate glycosyltransferase
MQILAPRTLATPSLSLVIPAFNEAHHLATLISQVLSTLDHEISALEIIVINDGSTDHTPAVLHNLCSAEPRIVAIHLSRNFGKESALSAGLDAAKGDVVVLMDADGQHPIPLILTMIEHWRQGFEVVYAVRKSRSDQSAAQIKLTQLFYTLINWGNKVQIPADAGDFRLMSRPVIEALNSMPERNRFMKGLYAWVGFPSIALDYTPLDRAQGRSKFGFKGSLALALTGMVAFSVAPLRLLSLLGFALSLAAMGYGSWVIAEYFLYGIDVPGYATIVVGLMFFSGIQLLSIGVLAEYVGRIYEEVKQRPKYLVSKKLGQGLSAPPRRQNDPAN